MSKLKHVAGDCDGMYSRERKPNIFHISISKKTEDDSDSEDEMGGTPVGTSGEGDIGKLDCDIGGDGRSGEEAGLFALLEVRRISQ